ncbi:hypothetical protein [Fibrobacter sp.]|uniref:DUF1281 family ferredoxin-like fold protein n=1 Tax=Fibrobacter sp. TaxID=35828 RepID=UPI00386570EA
MPNWVNNQLVIKGEKATLEEIAKKGKPVYIVPANMTVAEFIRHECEKDNLTEHCTNLLIQRYEGVEPDAERKIPVFDIYGNTDAFSFNLFVPQDKTDPNYHNGLEAHCGTEFNWFDWNIDHWGTKWDASDSSVEWEGDALVVKFNTAWSVPEEFIKALSKLYPKVSIAVYAYEEQGQYTHGVYADGVGDMAPYVWCSEQVDRDEIAKKFLDDFAQKNGIENIADIINLETFKEKAFFDVQDEEDIRKYAEPTVVINYFDDNKELLELLKQSTDEGDWEYDEKENKFSFKK